MTILASQLFACLIPKSCIRSSHKKAAGALTPVIAPPRPRYGCVCSSESKATHVFPDRSGIASVVQDDVAADMLVFLRRYGFGSVQEKALWTFNGILEKAP